ncbi:MAG: SRPBCC family protein [Flavobacteriia bacterium]|nr:SRPBCC family protein [Flavobacteriia bacterium]
MYTLKRTQRIPMSLEEAWKFFSAPANLQKITPKDLGFQILSEVPDEMYEGLFIHYKVSPLFGIKMNWTTEITHVRDKEFFVDEQRVGPYKIWHHEHHFVEIPGGVEMTDIVSYQLPLGILGRIVHPILVKSRLENIFEHRFKTVEEKFGKYEKEQAA